MRVGLGVWVGCKLGWLLGWLVCACGVGACGLGRVGWSGWVGISLDLTKDDAGGKVSRVALNSALATNPSMQRKEAPVGAGGRACCPANI